MGRITKSKMLRRTVLYCIGALSATAVWAMVLKSVDRTADLSDVLLFVGGAFGGELLLCLCKRIFAKKGESNESDL